jgi:CheY-like chemotaxis protein
MGLHPAPKDGAGTEHLLVVDDEEIVRTLVARLLVGFGYRVQSAPNGDEALRLIRGGATFDLLLTDIALPGMSGGELSEQVASVAPGTKILFMSGHAADEASLRGAGPSSFLAKPFTAEELAAGVRGALDA